MPPQIWINSSHHANKIILGTVSIYAQEGFVATFALALALDLNLTPPPSPLLSPLVLDLDLNSQPQPQPPHPRACPQFLFEGRDGGSQAQAFLESEGTWQRAADKLADLCVAYGFDGWLINVEASLGPTRGVFVSFLEYLTRKMKGRVGEHAQVIYYDAHAADGSYAHQDALLPRNKDLFQACDGIFINYQWYEYDTLARSKAEAGDRQFDVYAGVDVWARNCEYDEGPGCKRAVGRAKERGVSVAIFGPGWVQEKGPGHGERPGSEEARRVSNAFWDSALDH